MITSENISWQISTGDMSQMQGPISIRPSNTYENTLAQVPSGRLLLKVTGHPASLPGSKPRTEHCQRSFLRKKGDNLSSFLCSECAMTAAHAAVDTKTFLFVSLPTYHKIMLSIFERAATAVALHFSYGNTTSTHFNSFSHILARLESCPQ